MMAPDGPYPLMVEQEFALLLDGLKDVRRRNPLTKGIRRERVAEHSWHIAICVMLLHEAAPEPIDVCRAVKMSLVHDLPELYAGDTFAFGNGTSTQVAREQKAMRKLRAKAGQRKAVSELLDLWDEYEKQTTPEAKFVKAIDAYLPIVLNHANIEHSSWKRRDVAASKVYERVDRVKWFLGDLANRCYHLIDEARDRNVLR